ncbi:MAG: helix-turn-helix transcriptional regulator [Clostridiaceae bacterium]|nr:helix-turn-helix transcriptional regulator [Clostridiaceae bacterium]
MNEVSLHVGNRIRLYRKAKKLTLLTLSQKIHKSKATLSKYETGDITVDVETLFDIADVLGIKVQQLIDYTPISKPNPSGQKPTGSFFPQRHIYIYFYDGRVGKIIKNLLEVDHESPHGTATFYNDIPAFDKFEECRNLYFGSVDYYDTVTNFSFENQSNRIEHVVLCAVNPFDRGEQVLGLLSGISRYPILPISIKCILSPVILEENEELMEKLILSKKDIKLIKSLNMFAVEQLS